MKDLVFGAAVSFALALVMPLPLNAETVTSASVTRTYADIARAGYEDSLAGARALDAAIDSLVAAPSAATLGAAREAWISARVPYQQTEVFRFGNPIVDEWEGRVNSWPLDEGMIDYVDASYGTESDDNPLYSINVISQSTIKVNGKTVDASRITPTLLSDTLHEAGSVEANVATGYHAIEFLLWGQDLNGTGPGAGMRPASDFDTANCTGGNCDRRIQYLKAASTLLIADLKEMVANWGDNGAARETLMADPTVGLAAILIGMGSLSYGELAGERMKLGLPLHDPEEEQDCFSDNTFNSHYYDQLGIRNVYTGRYQRSDGSVLSGPSIGELIKQADPNLDQDVRAALDHTVAAMARMKSRGESIEAYDQMIAEGNVAGNAIVQAAIDALIAQTRPIQRAITVLQLGQVEFEGSDSLDKPSAVFQ